MAPLSHFGNKWRVGARQCPQTFEQWLWAGRSVADSQQVQQRAGCLCIQVRFDEWFFGAQKRLRFRGAPEQFRPVGEVVPRCPEGRVGLETGESNRAIKVPELLDGYRCYLSEMPGRTSLQTSMTGVVFKIRVINVAQMSPSSLAKEPQCSQWVESKSQSVIAKLSRL